MLRLLSVIFCLMIWPVVNSQEEWVRSASGLIVARVWPSVVLYNRTLIVMGGCADAECTEHLCDMVVYVPENEISWSIGAIPVRLSVPNVDPKLPPILIPLGVAGPSAAVVVYDAEGREKVWIIGGCTFLRKYDSNTTRSEIHSTAWSLSMDLRTMEEAVKVPQSMPLRANASCHAVGSIIFIVGGVDVDTLEPLVGIDVIDTQTMSYHAGVASLPFPVDTASMASDSELLYIIGSTETWMEDHTSASSTSVWAINIPSLLLNGYLNLTLTALPKLPFHANLQGDDDVRVLPFGGIVAVKVGGNALYTWKACLRPLSGDSWVAMPSPPPPVGRSLVVGYPRSFFDGVSLLLYTLGGIDAGGAPSRDVWVFRTTLRLSGIGEVPSVVVVRAWVLLEFIPIVSGFVRLANTPQCLAPTAETADTYVNITEAVNDGLIPLAQFYPQKEVWRAYVCFSEEVQTRKTNEGVFYTAINPSRPIHIVEPFVPSPPTTTTPTENPPLERTRGTLIAAAVVGAGIVVSFGIAAVATWQWKLRTAARAGKNDDADDERAEPIKHATRGGRYETIRKIGQGAFSNVYLVRRTSDGIFMALKLILCEDDRSRLEAIRECETIHTIQGHPNIIKLYDMSMSYEFAEPEQIGSDMSLPGRRPSSPTNRGTPRESLLTSPTLRAAPPRPRRYLCLVTQYHPDGDLCRHLLTHLGDRSPLTLRAPILNEAQLVSVAQQLTSALAHIHQQRPPIVHRDVKPENVLISGTMTEHVIPVVLTDFGLAFLLEERRKCGHGGGTRPYIAPEVWKGQATTASDMWSLGCVLFAISTARLTVESVRLMSEEAKHPSFTQGIKHELQKLGLSEAWSRLITSLLQEAPKSRPTAAALLDVFDVDCSGSVALREQALPGEEPPP